MKTDNVIEKATYHLNNWAEHALGCSLGRYMFILASLMVYGYYKGIISNEYESSKVIIRCQRALRATGNHRIPFFIEKIGNKILQKCLTENVLFIESYRSSKEGKKYYDEFSKYGIDYMCRIKYPRKPEIPGRQGDLIVLKPNMSRNEKGVLLLQYTESIKKMVALYEIGKFLKKYILVVEPSWWGYEDTILFLLFGHGGTIIIEAQYRPDFKFIDSIKNDVYAITMGAGDWSDPGLFTYNPLIAKEYDIVMVANWGRIKRHSLLFQALAKAKSEIKLSVALIGFPTLYRTSRDVVGEARHYGVEDQVDIFESISAHEVSTIIQKAKTNVLLTKREGANRGIYEAFFCNVPVVLVSSNKGVNREHINEHTGIVSSDLDLWKNLIWMVEHYQMFSPRKWANENTGYINSTKKLNAILRNIALKKGEEWTQDIFAKKNVPNAIYVNDSERKTAEEEMNVLKEYLR